MPSCHSYSIEVHVTMPTFTEERHNAIGRLQAGANQGAAPSFLP